MSDGSAHLFVVDDDQRIRTLLRRYLTRHGHRVTIAAEAGQARRILAGLEFDLVIADVMMPGEDGVSLTRWIREALRTPVIMLTARGEIEDRILGLESGADDYLAKPFEPRELLLRIEAVLRRAAMSPTAPEPPRTVALGDALYDLARGELWRGGEPIRLTSGEAGLMRALARAPNAPISRERLVAELGGGAGLASERAVDVQITRLRRKIEADPRRPRYLQTVRGEGYMLTPD